MKRNICLSIILILLTILSSCGVTPMEEGRSVNEYIFPYINFTLSEDGTYYSASILEDAAVASVYIPAYVDDFDGSIPVKFFTGFDSADDIVNLTSTTFESSSTEIKLSSLDQASLLYTLKFNTIDKNSTVWKNLPQLPHTENEEFIGWFLVNDPEVQITDGKVMVPGYTTLFPKWGTHTFKEVAAKKATCTESGWEAYHYCTNPNCDYTTKVEIPSLGHSIVKHEKSDPTCITIGYTRECWQCTRCGTYFSDSTGENEVTDTKDLIIPYTGHTSDGTIYHDDTEHWLRCSVCGDEYNREKHTYGNWYASEEEGYTQERKCDYCGFIQKSTEGHEWKKVDETDSTCVEVGHQEYWYCVNHDGEYSLSNDPIIIINETELHTAVDKALVPHKTPDSWEKNNDTHWKVCSVCHQKLYEEKHEFQYTFVAGGGRSVVVTRACIVCGEEGHTSSSGNSAFNLSAAFGEIRIVRGDGNIWTLSYYGNAKSCYWTDSKGNKLIDDPEEFSITYMTQGEGSFKVYCYAFDESGEIKDISFALLTAY